jgi:hypothetical protein
MDSRLEATGTCRHGRRRRRRPVSGLQTVGPGTGNGRAAPSPERGPGSSTESGTGRPHQPASRPSLPQPPTHPSASHHHLLPVPLLQPSHGLHSCAGSRTEARVTAPPGHPRCPRTRSFRRPTTAGTTRLRRCSARTRASGPTPPPVGSARWSPLVGARPSPTSPSWPAGTWAAVTTSSSSSLGGARRPSRSTDWRRSGFSAGRCGVGW